MHIHLSHCGVFLMFNRLKVIALLACMGGVSIATVTRAADPVPPRGTIVEDDVGFGGKKFRWISTGEKLVPAASPEGRAVEKETQR